MRDYNDRKENTGNKRYSEGKRYTRDDRNAKADRRADNDRRADSDRYPDNDAFAENAAIIEGRNAVMEALRSERSVDKVLVLDGNHDSALGSIIKEIKKHAETKLEFVSRQRLDSLSVTGGKHQGVIAFAAAYDYAEVSDILDRARERGEDPFIFVLDGIEDPHNLGAIIRTANLAGAHGVIIRLNRAVGLTATVAKASAGALNYTPVAKVSNIARTIDELKEQGLWFVCADMGGESMYKLNLTGPIGLVIGNEGKGVSELVRRKCDMTAAIPQFGSIDSLNASVAAGVLAYEIVRQRITSAAKNNG